MWELVWHFLAGAVLLLYLASTFRRRTRQSTGGDAEEESLTSKTGVTTAPGENGRVTVGKASVSDLTPQTVPSGKAHLDPKYEKILSLETRNIRTGGVYIPRGIASNDAATTCEGGIVHKYCENRTGDGGSEGEGDEDVRDEGFIEIGRNKLSMECVEAESVERISKDIFKEVCGEGCYKDFYEQFRLVGFEAGLDEGSEGYYEEFGRGGSEEYSERLLNGSEESIDVGSEEYSEGLRKGGSEESLDEECLEEHSEEPNCGSEEYSEKLREYSYEESLDEEYSGGLRRGSNESLDDECSEEYSESLKRGSSEVFHKEGYEEVSDEGSEESVSEESYEEVSEEGSEESLEEEVSKGDSEEDIEDISSEDDDENKWNSSKNIFGTREVINDTCEDTLIKPRKIALGAPVSFLQELTARQRELCNRNKLGNNVDHDTTQEETLVQPHKTTHNPVPFLEELRLRQKALKSVNREARDNESDSRVSCLQAFPAERDEVVGGCSILADRKEKLDAAKQCWKKRVEPTDAVKFSVAGKMKLENKAADQPSALPQQNGERKHRMPQRSRFRSKVAQLKEVSSTPSSPQKEITPLFKRSISAPSGDEEDLSDQEPMLNGSKVVIPRTDDETFTTFFRSASDLSEKEQLQINVEDLDLVISKSSQLSVQKRTVKVQRRHVASRNPIKALASRVDIQEEYLEVRTGVAEKELRRLNMEKLAKNSSFAVEALAGLASKEDFTSVALKKALPSSAAMLPHKDLMLLHVKGRRHVQTRLVEPTPSSINSGDSYVLVTPGDVYHWVGTYANVIERSRGAEVALHVQQKRDLGYCSAGSVITIYEEKVASSSSSAAKKFWRLLGGDEYTKAVEAGHPDEDELYESSIIDTNIVYEVEDEELVPMNEYIGSIPKIEMLDPSKILVFDFGSEMYVWNGKTAPLERRKVALNLARELWAEGFDYSECDVCPVTVAETLGSQHERPDNPTLEGPMRPEWALLCKVTQHMETILFREKFLDWPDFTRVIRSKDIEDVDKQVDASIDISPCDAGEMLKENQNYPDLVLEGSHLGRGDMYYDEENHRHYEITTQGVTMWHVMEFESAQLPASSLGQFHTADSYVVRWTYSITVTGRELNGQPSRHSMAGRDRCGYFCWQGSEAPLNEQGAAALLTVELDHERGPQVRVVQGAEPPAFLRLFQGAMVVHSGFRECEHVNHRKGWRLYVCRGERQQEAALVQVTCSVRSLRSRASFVLVRTATGTVYVWHGAKTSPHSQKTAMHAAEHLKEKPQEIEFPSQAEITVTVQHEGSESKDFFAALGGSNRQLYVSLRKDSKAYDYSPRLFHLSSLSGSFSATEVVSPLRDGDTVVGYPFLQSDLYSPNQPELFLLDNHHELWLWQGWWPDCGEETSLDNSFVRGSRVVLWQMERRAAMQTALDYWRLKHGNAVTPQAYLVWAGLEPLRFTNLFPMWTDRDDVAELNISDGRKPGELLTVEGELARLTRSTYPAAQLLQRPLPDGVDPTRLEVYLEPSHFQELLGMAKEEFLDLPTWKQTKLKKEVGLF